MASEGQVRTSRPNILLIVTDEERVLLPRPQGSACPRGSGSPPAGPASSAITPLRRCAARPGRSSTPGSTCLSPRSTTTTTCRMSARSILSWAHLGRCCGPPATTPPTRASGTPPTRTSRNPGPTTDALEPYGFSEFNGWGDIDGGAWAGLELDPVIAGQAVRWLRSRAPVVFQEKHWFMAVNFVNPHDIMSFDYGGSSQVQLPFGLAHAVVARAAATSPSISAAGTSACPPACTTIFPAPRRPSRSTLGGLTPSSVPSPTTSTGTTAST